MGEGRLLWQSHSRRGDGPYKKSWGGPCGPPQHQPRLKKAGATPAHTFDGADNPPPTLELKFLQCFVVHGDRIMAVVLFVLHTDGCRVLCQHGFCGVL